MYKSNNVPESLLERVCVNGTAEEPPAHHLTHGEIHVWFDFCLQHSFNCLVNVLN